MESYINIDKNMIVEKTVGDIDVVWYDVKEAPFMLHGFYNPLTEPYYHRLPTDVAIATSENVAKLEKEAAGGRVRFSTDSPYIAIRAKFRVVGRSPHLTLLSSAGFDLYTDGEFGSRFIKEFRMPYDMVDYYEKNIAVRGGLHCSPLAHKSLNTPDGLVRLSVSCFNTNSDIDNAIDAVYKISKQK